MEKIYPVELNIFKENAIYDLQKILLDNFFPKLLYLKCHREYSDITQRHLGSSAAPKRGWTGMRSFRGLRYMDFEWK